MQLDWGDSEEPSQLTTDRKGRCAATWSSHDEGAYRVTASFAGDDHYLPATAVDEFQVGGQVATHLAIALVKPAEDLPFIWGVGESVHVNVMLLDDSGEGMGGRTVTMVIDEPDQPVGLLTDADGRCHTSWTGYRARDISDCGRTSPAETSTCQPLPTTSSKWWIFGRTWSVASIPSCRGSAKGSPAFRNRPPPGRWK